MNYRKDEAKQAAREILKGVWTAMPYCWDASDEFDEAANRANMEHIITGLEIDGHYCSGNIAEFWSMPDEERMRAHEVMIDAAAGRIPMIAGCHHQSVKQAAKLARHAQDIGYDFVIVLTPYIAARNDDAVFAYYEYICERVDIGVILFNIPHTCHPVSPQLAQRLTALPNICAYKQGDTSPAATHALMHEMGDELVISVADEAPWLQSMTQLGLQWLLNYNPHLYQVPGYLPLKDYTERALAGDITGAAKIAASLQAIREVHGKWIMGYWLAGRMPLAEMKYWQELIGMNGGPVRPPVTAMGEDAKAEMRADLSATGLIDRASRPAQAAE
ncbi:MAG: 4-hydroxy-tetrahydrodipicolinate synthase [Alphaproteobacteria bacterium]|jgi:4-hydroxy-tetrahydrodipicolinate synthase